MSKVAGSCLLPGSMREHHSRFGVDFLDECHSTSSGPTLGTRLRREGHFRRKAMQYLLICCCDESLWAKLPEAERGRIMGEYGRFIQDLKASGRLLAGAKLDQCASAVTVREKNGKPFITDGPFAETKEQLGGYHLVECRDRDEAVAIALRIPTLPIGGTIEVRPVLWPE
jgi:hypothetical protein